MPESRVTVTATRYAGLYVRHYAGVYCVGVPYDPPRPGKLYRPPFKDTWYRFAATDDATPEPVDVGPIFRTRAEAMGDLARYAADHGYTERA